MDSSVGFLSPFPSILVTYGNKCVVRYDCVSLAVGGWVLGEELRCESLYLSVALWHCDRCGWLLAVVVGCCLCLGLLVGFVPNTSTSRFLCFHHSCVRAAVVVVHIGS